MSFTMPEDEDDRLWWRLDVSSEDPNRPTDVELQGIDRWLDEYRPMTPERAFLLDLGGNRARRRTQGETMRRRLGLGDAAGPYSTYLAYSHIERFLELHEQKRSIDLRSAARHVVTPDADWLPGNRANWLWSEPSTAYGWALVENGWDQEVDFESVGPRRWDRLTDALADCYVDRMAPHAWSLLVSLGQAGWIRFLNEQS